MICAQSAEHEPGMDKRIQMCYTNSRISANIFVRKDTFNMKKQWTLPLTAALGGAAAFVLRLVQKRTGFESATGLPIPGNAAGTTLVVLLLVLAVLLLLLVRQLPRETEQGPAFPADFSTGDTKLLTLPVIGVFLMALAGLADLYEGLGLGSLLTQMSTAAAEPDYAEIPVLLTGSSGFSPRAQLLMGLLSILSAAGLFFSLLACRPKDDAAPKAFNGNLLLIAPVALVVRLVLTYRVDSVDPSLSAYYVELLALVFLTLGFYRLSSFAFRAGRTRRFALYAGAAVIFSIAALADGTQYLSSILLYAGGALALLGFLLLRLTARPQAGEDSAIIA